MKTMVCRCGVLVLFLALMAFLIPFSQVATAQEVVKTVPEKKEAAPAAQQVVPGKTSPAEEPVETVVIETEPEARKAVDEHLNIPTIDSVKTVLSEFSHEPSVQEIQEVAMRFAEIHPDLIESWRKGAKFRGLVPRFTLDFDHRNINRDRERTVDELRRYSREEWGTYLGETITPGTGLDTTTEWSDKFYSYAQTIDRLDLEDSQSTENRWRLQWRWELGDFLFNREQIRISDEARDLVELRNDVLERVTTFYFQRRQLQIDILLSPPEDLRERLRIELQLQEVTANIDYLTGGYLTQRLNDVKQGKTRKAGTMRRLFAI